jgi:8-oxo-dGTP pyrophosphatase MutT (NUDIX family)
MRQSEAAVAVIRLVRDGQTHLLAQWNAKWGAFNFIAGHRRPDETFRECLVREIAEELHLGEGPDYRVSADLPIHLEFVDFSERTQTQTRYIMELFNVELCLGACTQVESNSANRWLSAAEIEAGQTRDGRTVSATMKRLHKEIERES